MSGPDGGFIVQTRGPEEEDSPILLPPLPYVSIAGPQDTSVPEPATARIFLPSPVHPAFEPFGAPTVRNPLTTR